MTLESRHGRAEALKLARESPAVVAGDLTRRHGHQGALRRPGLEDQVDQPRMVLALDVQLDTRVTLREVPSQGQHVAEADVSLVQSRMDGDAVCTCLYAHVGRGQEVGCISLA